MARLPRGTLGQLGEPSSPEGDVQPAPAEGTVPAQEQAAVVASRLVLNQQPTTPGVSPTRASSKDTLASGTLWIVIPASDVDTSGDEMGVSASPPRLPGSQGLATDLLTDAVTAAVIHRQQVEDEAAASSSHSQEEGLSGQQSSRADLGPRRTDHSGSEEPAGTNPTGARPRVGQKAIAPVETHTSEEVEGAVWQSARGTSDGAIGYALAILDRIRTDVEDRFRFQTQALRDGRQEGEEFGCNPQLQNLLGRMRYLWE